MIKTYDIDECGAQSGIKPVAIEHPTKPGQVPVSEHVSGGGVNDYFYKAKTLPKVPDLSSADVTKTWRIKSVDANGQPEYEVANFAPADEGTLSLLNQKGIIGNPAITHTANTIVIEPFTAVIYDFPTGGSQTQKVRILIEKNTSNTITINAAKSTTTPKHNFTYVWLTKDGAFAQTTTFPAPDDFIKKLFLCEVYHPNGGDIALIKPLYIVYEGVQSVINNFANAVPSIAKHFIIDYKKSDQSISQTSNFALIAGYNINPKVGALDRSNIFFGPSTKITFEYFSFDDGEKIASTDTLKREYKLDDPHAGTSLSFSGFGILLLFVDFNKKYVLLASQKSYSDQDKAAQDFILYSASCVKPKYLEKYGIPVAAIIVEHEIADDSSKVVVENIGNLGFGSASSAVSPIQIPDPSTGSPGEVIKVKADGSGFELGPSGAPDYVDLSNPGPAKLLMTDPAHPDKLILKEPTSVPAWYEYLDGDKGIMRKFYFKYNFDTHTLDKSSFASKGGSPHDVTDIIATPGHQNTLTVVFSDKNMGLFGETKLNCASVVVGEYSPELNSFVYNPTYPELKGGYKLCGFEYSYVKLDR